MIINHDSNPNLFALAIDRNSNRQLMKNIRYCCIPSV